MMKHLVVLLLSLSFSFPAIAGDAKIARVRGRLWSDPFCITGGFPLLDLPRSASIQQVVARRLQMSWFGSRHIKHYRVRAVEKLPWEKEPAGLTAVRITSDLGDKVILMRYDGG